MRFILSTYCLMISLFTYAEKYEVKNVDAFNEILLKVQAGDEIVWLNGNYVDTRICFNSKTRGSANHPITLRAETPGKVIFSGKSKISIGGSYLKVDGFLFQGTCSFTEGENVIDFRSGSGKAGVLAEHCRVTNCAIIDYSPTEESGITNYYVNLVGTHNELDHCYFKGKINKGPTVIIEYKQDSGFVPGSDVAPSTYHHIHHNYFGYRTFSSNGGEQLRVGTSTTSFSHGFNIVEYNYFEDEQIEAEVISNKSSNNIYRFNTMIANDGALVIRHGHNCFVYGNYINGKSGRKTSGGIRLINPDNTAFNNYLEDLEGGAKGMKAPLSIMSGLEGSALNEYYPADNAIVAYNTVVASVGPAISLGVGNPAKGKPNVAPKNVLLVGNLIVDAVGQNTAPIDIVDKNSTFIARENYYNNGSTQLSGFQLLNTKSIKSKEGFSFYEKSVDDAVVDSINKRLSIHSIKLSKEEISVFNPDWKLNKKDVGVSWIK